MYKRIISFRNKTYAQIIEAYGKLKARYKGFVVSFRFTGNSGSLRHGYIQVA